MNREKMLLKLLSEDLHALHYSAVILEKDLHRLALEIESQDLASLAGLVSQINCLGYAPIEKMLREAGLPGASSTDDGRPVLSGVLAEVGEYASRMDGRLSAAQAISIMRRAARYMEMYCTSIADSAVRLRMNHLAPHLRAWAREWIGLELHLNAVAARPRTRETIREREAAVAAA
jgi:hypothetical protein